MREPEPQADSYKEEFFMASNYTDNYQLCQWEATDQVQRTEFNADNAKIDAALAKTCQPYIISYTGDGNPTRTMEFPGKPLFVLAIGGSVLLTAIRGEGTAHSIFSSLAERNFATSWGENSFTWDIGSEAIAYSANNFDVPYQMFALLSME